MGEDCKAKIEVVLNNEDHVEMYLNGKTTTLQNMAISVMTQTIAPGADSLDDAKLQLVEAVFALPLALEKAWKEKEADNAASTDKSVAADTAQDAAMCGGHPVWASEIEPYPIAVTKTHLPNMKHLGSVTDIKGFLIEPVDIITFGSPCQDLSIAGKRAGLDGARSGLFWEAVRIIREMLLATGGKYPRFVIWENVPGALSSNKGKDFEVVLNELLHLREFAGGRANQSILQHGKWGGFANYGAVAYRIVNAQHWGIPQRRRRVYAVCDTSGESAGVVVFERKGTEWNFEPCIPQGKEVAGLTADCYSWHDRMVATKPCGGGGSGKPTQ